MPRERHRRFRAMMMRMSRWYWGDEEGRLEVLVGGVDLPSKVTLVGVNAVDTSEIDTESFRIMNCAGDAGGEADRSEVGFASAIEMSVDLVSKGVDDGGTGKSGIADFGATDSGRSLAAPEFFRLGMSPNFQSCEPAAL